MDRRAVNGTVTLDGNPLPNGSLTLMPLNNGPVCYGAVLDGRFEIEKSQGPIPGEYKVVITGTRKTGRTLKIADPVGETRETPEVVSIVPMRYADHSKLRLLVKPEDNVVSADYTLTSD